MEEDSWYTGNMNHANCANLLVSVSPVLMGDSSPSSEEEGQIESSSAASARSNSEPIDRTPSQDIINVAIVGQAEGQKIVKNKSKESEMDSRNAPNKKRFSPEGKWKHDLYAPQSPQTSEADHKHAKQNSPRIYNALPRSTKSESNFKNYSNHQPNQGIKETSISKSFDSPQKKKFTSSFEFFYTGNSEENNASNLNAKQRIYDKKPNIPKSASSLNMNRSIFSLDTTTSENHSLSLRSISEDRKNCNGPMALDEFFKEMSEIKKYNDSVPDSDFLG